MKRCRVGSPIAFAAIVLAALLALAACGGSPDPAPTDAEPTGSITLYSGRSEDLVGPLIAQFEAATGIDVRVRYAGSAALAGLLLEEGPRSPADVFLAQDAGALGAIEDAALFDALPTAVLERVDARFRSGAGAWVGVSGRARVLVYSSDRVSDNELPASIFDLTEPAWQGRVGWAPTNGSFQAFVTAMRQSLGDDRTADWLRAMIANGVQEYTANTPIVRAVGDGEIDVGLVNHYYLFRFLAEDPDFAAANLYTDPGQAGALINVAGIGLLRTSRNTPAAMRFIEYLLEADAQQYFATETNEYPLAVNATLNAAIPPLETLDPPSLSLTSLSDLEGTLDLLREVGALP